MNKKMSTLYIDDGGLRVAVVQGNRVRKCAEEPLEPDQITDMVVADPDKLAASIGQFLQANKIKGRKFNIGINGVNCLMRQIDLPPLPRNLMEEAVLREARRLLPLPVEQLYLSWQVATAPGDRLLVFLVAVRRTSIDSLFKALKAARIKAESLIIKPMALARLIERDAILVDVQGSDLDVVLMLNGIPQPVRSVSFSSPTWTWREKLPFLLEEIDRTLKFYQANNPDKPIDSGLPMYVTGDLASQTKLWPRLTERFGFEVSRLTTAHEFPEGVEPGRFLVNVAMSLQEKGGLLSPARTIAGLNLLPAEYRIPPLKWQRVVAVPATVGFAGIVIPMSMLVMGASQNISSARSQLEATSKVLADKQTEKQALKKELATLQQSVAATLADRDGMAKVRDTIAVRAVAINTDLRTINVSVSQGVAVTSISFGEDTETVNGTASSEGAVLDYASTLKDSGRFGETVVSEIRLEEEGYVFTLILVK
jgi:type IV pilus assembly protein PilM